MSFIKDGRQFTDYTQSSIKNENIKNEYGIHDNQSYREFLTKHGDLIRKRNLDETKKVNPIYNQKGPYKFNGIMDDSRPFGYSFSDMKEVYLSREKLNSLRKRQFIEWV